MGTELARRGAETPEGVWSAHALVHAPEVVRAIHRDYARAGATVHTANTFRTKRRTLPDTWAELARRAVDLARSAVPPGHAVAGSIAPLEDCYRPDLSPPEPRAEHRELARVLADAGVDVLLCETFPHVGEALVAVEEAVATGRETWVAFTAGPKADLLSSAALAEGARRAADAGARVVLVNCVPAARCMPFVEQLARLGVPFGVYANAGDPSEGLGWIDERAPGAGAEAASARSRRAADAYRKHAERWVAAGAFVIGGCCGTGPAHIAALRSMLDARSGG